jgi:predicted nucleic acid-binding Zn ribbon protein
MPTYVYETLDKKGNGTGRTFEVFQSMKDPALTRHPETGQPVRRVPQAPGITTRGHGDNKGVLTNSNLERLGFTKYERKGKGYMERVAGKEGPRSISADD